MGTKDSSRREHDAVALGGFRECERILYMRESRPDEHAIRRLHKQLQPHTFEGAYDIEPRLAEPLVQPGQVLAVMTIYQHQIYEPLGELRGGDAGQHLNVGEFVGDGLRTG